MLAWKLNHVTRPPTHIGCLSDHNMEYDITFKVEWRHYNFADDPLTNESLFLRANQDAATNACKTVNST